MKINKKVPVSDQTIETVLPRPHLRYILSQRQKYFVSGNGTGYLPINVTVESLE